MEPPPPVPPAAYGTRIVGGVMVPILSVVSVLFFWFWAWAVFSLVTTGQVLGQALPDDVPFWVGILVLVCVYHAVAWPLHFARRRAAYYSFGGQRTTAARTAWDGVAVADVRILSSGWWCGSRTAIFPRSGRFFALSRTSGTVS